MKALQLKEYNHLEIVDAPKPSPKAGEVLIKVKACGICGSDIHGLDGSTGRRIPPLIMGHEASGIIEELGPGVKGYAKGDRVTFDSTLFCGECRYCREGHFNFCENRQVLGVACDEYPRDGAFADYVVVPAIVLYPMPDEVSFVQAAMIEPLAVAVHGVSITPITIGDTALLMGAGIIGLLTLQVLRTAGCGRIYVADVDEGRLKQAMDFGATGTFNPKKDDIPAEMKKLTGGLGAQIALDAVGIESTVHACLYSVRKGGNVTAIGNLAPEITLPLQHIVSHQITLRGSNASSGEFASSLQLIQSGRVDVDSLISKVAALEEGADYFTRLYNREAGLMKVILEP